MTWGELFCWLGIHSWGGWIWGDADKGWQRVCRRCGHRKTTALVPGSSSGQERDSTSLGPPGVKATMRLTGRAGYSAASDVPAQTMAKTARTDAQSLVMGELSVSTSTPSLPSRANERWVGAVRRVRGFTARERRGQGTGGRPDAIKSFLNS